ncbi:hypothetical protein CF327_g7168 [Tilletia walkeri]|uniref:Uncharacterized protein n=1 Tax=Tilletia walkeri TaxID=117179 RepID=A0A8X7N4C5_9BASI|nr:hypothetical protein CF327_g7168 [Tilletia walkeri]KAE8265039.1 hypothetical protein A4X09_0g6784 [Tilletia walkeri]
MAAPIRRNEDGTVDLGSVKTHVAHLKGKYAQNAANYEANTGHKMDFSAEHQADGHKHDDNHESKKHDEDKSK